MFPLLFVLATAALRFKDLIFNSAKVYRFPVGVDPLVPVSTQTSKRLNIGSLALISVAPGVVKAARAANPFGAVCPFGKTVADPKSCDPFVIDVAPGGKSTRKPSPGVIQPTFEACPVLPRSKETADLPICCV